MWMPVLDTGGKMKKYLFLFIIFLCFNLQIYSREEKLNYIIPYSITGILTEADFSERAALMPAKPIEQESFYPIGEWSSNAELYSSPRYVSIKNEQSGVALTINLLDFIDSNYQISGLSGAFFPKNNYIDFLLETSFYKESPFDDIFIYLIRFDFEKKETRLLAKECICSAMFNLISNNEFQESEKTFYQLLLNNSYSMTKHKCSTKVGYCGFRRLFQLESENNIVTQYASSKNNDFPNFLYISDVNYKAKTELKEGAVTYYASNLAEDSDVPWVSELKNISDEEIIITSPGVIYCLVFGNGFKHKDKNYLFSKNNRPKEITVEYENNHGIEHHIILEDTDKMQIIPLLFINSKKIRIKIISTYSGSSYDDTCINCIKCGKVMTYKEYEKLEK